MPVAAVFGRRLQVGLVKLAEAGEVVDVGAAQKRRQLVVERAEIDPGSQGPLAVDAQPPLGHPGIERRGHRGDRRDALQRIHQVPGRIEQVSGSAPFEVLHLERDARRDAQSRNGRRDEGIALRLGDSRVEHAGKFAGDPCGREPAVGVIDQLDEDDAARGRGDAGHHVESRGKGGRFDLGQRADRPVGRRHRLAGHLQRRGGRRRDHHHDVALVLLGKETRRKAAPHEQDRRRDHGHEERRAHDVPHERRREVRIARRQAVEPAVEGREEAPAAVLPGGAAAGRRAPAKGSGR